MMPVTASLIILTLIKTPIHSHIDNNIVSRILIDYDVYTDTNIIIEFRVQY